jgi:two-component system, OmpR family, sensor histidine kinase SenX3
MHFSEIGRKKGSMKVLPERTLSSLILLVALAAILVALAFLQYSWSGQVSKAEQERMHTSLLASINQFRLQLNHEFRQLAFLIQPDPAVLGREDWASYAETCDAVLGKSDLRYVRDIYLWLAAADGTSRLCKLDRSAKVFEPVPWPSRFETLRERYSRLFEDPRIPGPGLMPFTWTMFSGVPLMLHTLVSIQPSRQSSGPDIRFVGCLLLDLNDAIIYSELFPQLAKKNFAGSDGFIYQIAVVNGHDKDRVLYQSDPRLTLGAFARPDATISLFEAPRERFGSMGPRLERRPGQWGPVPMAPGRRPAPDEQMPPEPGLGGNSPARSRPTPPMGQLRSEPPPMQERAALSPVLFDDSSSGWELIAKHREGSLEIAVARLRRRNLAISLGSLVLLALSMGFIMVSARRAQTLARLQIDFVAGISHELRTPLAVICSAGDNLAEGITENSSQSTRKYGELIRDEGRKLAGMIDQLLQFASLRRTRHQFNLQPKDINEIAESALKQMRPTIETAGFSVEKTFEDSLPLLNVDAAVLSRVIQNLLQNALKYSGESRWLAIRTAKTSTRRGTGVQLIVEDKGFGIDSKDLPQIFNPFYRGSVAAAAQIHGTGLGLFMVREALNSMGGSISVKSVPGKGSTFTLYFPALPATGPIPSSAASEDSSKHAI